MSFQVPTNRLHIVQALRGAGPAERGSGHSSSWRHSESLCAQLGFSGLPLKSSSPCGSRGWPIGEAVPGETMCTLSKAAVTVPRLPWLPSLDTAGHEGHVGTGMCHCTHRAARAHCSGVSATQRQVQEHCVPTKPSSNCPPSVVLPLSPYRTEFYNNHLIQLPDQSRADQKLQHVVEPLSKCLLDTDRPRALTSSLGSLFQCMTTLSLKKHFLMTDLNLP